MSHKLSEIIANANDFDGVFYDPSLIPDYYNHFATTFGSTLIKMLPDAIDFEGATKLAVEGYEQYGDSVTGIMEWADKRGMKGEDFREEFFRSYHQNLFTHFTHVAPHVFMQKSDLVRAFDRIRGIVSNGIATHGCADNFTRPLLPGMHLTAYIQDNAIFGLADSGYLKKSTHSDLVDMCLKALDVLPEVAGYTEDTSLNLKAQKELMPSLTTIYINNGRPLATKPTYIDYEFKCFEDYLTALAVAHSEPRKLIMI